MKSKVYLSTISSSDGIPGTSAKLERLLLESRILDCVRPGESAAIKLHFGEKGNTGFVKPQFLRVVVQALKARQAGSFLSDTNTLYQGSRANSTDHLRLAHEHGFTPEAVGAGLAIPDDSRKENVRSVRLDGRFIKTAKVAEVYARADAFIGVAHFKGHIMTGFGGALKNVGMGCASREGKLAQHSDVSPVVSPRACIGCGSCVPACSVHAISLQDGRCAINADICIGCAQCLSTCQQGAIQVHWEAGGNVIQEKMVEYASAVLKPKKGKLAFINFCLKITAECDCIAKDDPSIAPDLGLLASADPVALDQACYDLVVKAAGRDVFKAAHPQRDGAKQLRYAEELGLGCREYELIKV